MDEFFDKKELESKSPEQLQEFLMKKQKGGTPEEIEELIKACYEARMAWQEKSEKEAKPIKVMGRQFNMVKNAE